MNDTNSTTPTDDDLLAAYTAVWDDTPINDTTRASALRLCREMLAFPTLEAAAAVTAWWLEDPTDPVEFERHTALVAEFRSRLGASAAPASDADEAIDEAIDRISATLADLADQLNLIAAVCRREKK